MCLVIIYQADGPNIECTLLKPGSNWETYEWVRTIVPGAIGYEQITRRPLFA